MWGVDSPNNGSNLPCIAFLSLPQSRICISTLFALRGISLDWAEWWSCPSSGNHQHFKLFVMDALATESPSEKNVGWSVICASSTGMSNWRIVYCILSKMKWNEMKGVYWVVGRNWTICTHQLAKTSTHHVWSSSSNATIHRKPLYYSMLSVLDDDM